MCSAIVCFYASSRYGSEYRSGLDFIEVAWREGFTLAIVSDIDQNDSPEMLEARFPGLTVIAVRSLVRKQRLLYRFTDFVPQFVWHRRVGARLKRRHRGLARLWINNGAQPWLPLGIYDRCFTGQLIWGPAGGDAGAPSAFLATCPPSVRLREWLRAIVVRVTTAAKVKLFERVGRSGRAVRVMARTREAANSLSAAGIRDVVIVPEIIAPLKASDVTKPIAQHPRLVWIGQDIPRKNLGMALEIFNRLKDQYFPGLTMEIHGVEAKPAGGDQAITYHGWTPGVPWDRYRAGGVLLLTSYREGLPSVVLEALSAGLPCVSADVGSIGSLDQAPVYLIPMETYPKVDAETLAGIATFIREQVSREHYRLEGVNHSSTIARLIATKD